MDRAILLSIKPEYVAKILSGEKTIEIRKTKPSIDLPVKVYIYCTHGSKLTNEITLEEYQKLKAKNPKNYIVNRSTVLNGKVVAEFTLNNVEKFDWQSGNIDIQFDYLTKHACVDDMKLEEYSDFYHKTIYAWQIYNLKIYKKPEYLSEFRKPCKEFHRISENKQGGIIFEDGWEEGEKLTKAPQSFCYVEQEEKHEQKKR